MVSTSEEYFFLISLEVLWLKIRPNKRSDRTIYPIQDEHRRINSECKSVRKSNYSKKHPIAADQMLSHITQKWSCWWLWFPLGQEAELVTLLGPSVGVGESMGSSRGFVGRVSGSLGQLPPAVVVEGDWRGNTNWDLSQSKPPFPPALPWEWDVIHSWVCSNCAFMSN